MGTRVHHPSVLRVMKINTMVKMELIVLSVTRPKAGAINRPSTDRMIWGSKTLNIGKAKSDACACHRVIKLCGRDPTSVDYSCLAVWLAVLRKPGLPMNQTRMIPIANRIVFKANGRERFKAES